ncbi:hypothetical protein Desaci_0593 [Desulfosporosinus acidiphilus SJ4]|uniref:Uncharacterized protein n=1 Tax=Desulfosporosinus acidiphilus (strain DSM 22704 / JCM 16185 / SJ4) TaxID=646529 RepID=I4D1I1_DESAJ|nr:hypothetical protein Desaci_0593 [Desulfosporosinus acidiphilus SJ4]
MKDKDNCAKLKPPDGEAFFMPIRKYNLLLKTARRVNRCETVSSSSSISQTKSAAFARGCKTANFCEDSILAKAKVSLFSLYLCHICHPVFIR